LKEMFADRVCAIGRAVAAERAPAAIVGEEQPLPPLSLAFLFPGQGSYDAALLRELYDAHPGKRHYFEHADAVARRAWGHGFLPLIHATSNEEHDALLRQCPELDQLGIFLAAVVTAEALVERGTRPDVLVGHSFGELAALCVGGAFDALTGVEIVVARVDALRDAGYGVGGMLALSTGVERARELLSVLNASDVDVAGVNAAKQVVVSGPRTTLERLVKELPAHGAMGTVLKSRHPFHSRMLRPAVDLFASALRGRRYGRLHTPVYSPIERALYPADVDVPAALSSHFVRPFDFVRTIQELRTAGVQSFVECSAGEVLARIVRKNLPDAPADVAQAATAFLTAREEQSAGPMPIAIVSLG